ncbi:pteridine reductase [Natronospira proteinivora]|uniref:Pteridine reductase n=1 Tax=Natronospira proteinivora TaxID=1807133 RepID=A0ABT1GAV4_9GAMM|nr:pteridine reductase [Natronospira proteinivora]MCP1728449.1 pteridine reductase [Natronospira proteinivora]
MQDNTPSLSGKTALVTGAARRIGATIAETLHQAGMNVVIHYRHSATEAETLADTLNTRRRDSAVTAQADLLAPDGFPSLIKTAEQWGGLDLLVNNASSFYATPVGEAEESHWDELIGSNLKGPFFLSQAATPSLTARQGQIINIVDIHGYRPLARHPIYSVAKAGLLMLTRSLAGELAPAVRVNGIAPGAILWPEQPMDAATQNTILDRIPLARSGHPQDIANAVLFLVRDGSYINGQVIPVDGGRSAVE